MNPCPCGYLGHGLRDCRCARRDLGRYRARVSGPLLDRLDIHVGLPPVELGSLTAHASGESSAEVRNRVVRARDIQSRRRARGETEASVNAELPMKDFAKLAPLMRNGRRLLESAMSNLGLSARAFSKIVRVARTIADLEQSERVEDNHIAEAIQYRMMSEE